MPNFKTHQYINYIILILISILLYYFGQLNYLFLIFIIGYIFGTQYITPDLDINSKPSNNILWSLYKRLSHHRGKTHALLYGFLFPILYLTIILFVIIYIIGIISGVNNLLYLFVKNLLEIMSQYNIHILIFISGIGIANGIHIIADRIVEKL